MVKILKRVELGFGVEFGFI